MADTAQIRETCREISARLEGRPAWPELRAVYLDMAPLVGQLQGLVNDARRAHGGGVETLESARALEQLKAQLRQVGLDMRLASEPALLMGLQMALESAAQTLDRLERVH